MRLHSVFVLRTADPPITAVEGRTVRELRRIGKRIAIGVEDGLCWLVIHLMIAGRLHWRPPQAKLSGRQALLALDFSDGTLVLTEAGSKRRASLHLLRGEQALRDIDPGGIEVFSSDLDAFRAALTAENRTLKRALTDPRIISGVGNAYSDEILHAAQLSPIALTHKLRPEEWERLFTATRFTLDLWIARLSSKARKDFPKASLHSVRKWPFTAALASPARAVARPFNVFATPTTKPTTAPPARPAAKLLADRSLSRLLGSDWPRSLDELEALKRR